jgi:hypothetical protein
MPETQDTGAPFHRAINLIPAGGRIAVEDSPAEAGRPSGLLVVSSEEYVVGGVVVGVPEHIDEMDAINWPWLKLGAVVYYRRGSAIEIKGVKFVEYDDIIAWEPSL